SFFPRTAALLTQASAHGRLFLIGAVDPTVKPRHLLLDARSIGAKLQQVAADFDGSRWKFSRWRLLRIVKKPLPIRRWRFGELYLNQIKIISQLLQCQRRPRSPDAVGHSFSLEVPIQALPVDTSKMVSRMTLLQFSSASSIRRRPRIRRRSLRRRR